VVAALVCALSALLTAGFGRTAHLVLTPHAYGEGGKLVHLAESRVESSPDEGMGVEAAHEHDDECEACAVEPASASDLAAAKLDRLLDWQLLALAAGPTQPCAALAPLTLAPKQSPPTRA